MALTSQQTVLVYIFSSQVIKLHFCMNISFDDAGKIRELLASYDDGKCVAISISK